MLGASMTGLLPDRLVGTTASRWRFPQTSTLPCTIISPKIATTSWRLALVMGCGTRRDAPLRTRLRNSAQANRQRSPPIPSVFLPARLQRPEIQTGPSQTGTFHLGHTPATCHQNPRAENNSRSFERRDPRRLSPGLPNARNRQTTRRSQPVNAKASTNSLSHSLLHSSIRNRGAFTARMMVSPSAKGLSFFVA